jgi:hypothetical protein
VTPGGANTLLKCLALVHRVGGRTHVRGRSLPGAEDAPENPVEASSAGYWPAVASAGHVPAKDENRGRT